MEDRGGSIIVCDSSSRASERVPFTPQTGSQEQAAEADPGPGADGEVATEEAGSSRGDQFVDAISTPPDAGRQPSTSGSARGQARGRYALSKFVGIC